MDDIVQGKFEAAHEQQRLAALGSLGILDTPPEERFDRIVRTAVRLCRMPKSFLALVDESRAWVKASVGTDIREVSRQSSIAGLAIESEAALVVPDTRDHPRFMGHPLVVGPDRIRSLVAHPIRTPDRYPVGALCVMDTAPHHFTADELSALTDLCLLAEEELADIELTRLLTLNNEVQARIHAVVDATSEGILLIGDDGVMEYHNRRLTQLFGLPDDAIEGQSFDALNERVDGIFADGAEFRARMSQAAEHPDEVSRFAIKQHYPEVRDLEVYSAPVTGREGRDWGRLLAFRDVTRERELDRMKDEFVSLVSHELRTPLTSIKGYVDLLLDGDAGEVTDEQSEFLKIVQHNSDRLVMLVNDLLDVSRIEAGRINLRIGPVDLADCVREVAASLEPLIDGKGQSLRLELPDDLSPVEADRDRVVQILSNLLSNAHKYTLDGGSIKVSATVAAGFVRVNVSDSGVGMTPEELGKLFTKFFRAQHPATQKVGGTGLGLNITRSLIEKQGGRIWVTSEPMRGSTFSFTLPCEMAPAAAEPAAPVVDGAHLARHPVPKVLVVDDEPDIAGLIRRYLERGGYSVLVARDARSALESARREGPDLITLDVKLPDADGFTVLEWLKADPATAAIPVVMLSVVDDAGKGQLLGAVDYLRKPVDEQMLLHHVRSIVGSPDPQVVVVADDEPETRSLIAAHLRRAGHLVLEAADGAEALRLSRGDPRPQLMLLDLRMPELDGVGVLAALRGDEATRSLPVVMMTTSLGISASDRSVIERLGATLLLHKPSSAEELAELLGQGLKRESA